MSERRALYEELSASDLEVDCAPEGRVPYLGLHNKPTCDEVDSSMYHHKEQYLPQERGSPDHPAQTKMQRQDSNYDSGLDDGIFSIEEKIDSLSVSEETQVEQSHTTKCPSKKLDSGGVEQSVLSVDEAYFSTGAERNLNCLAQQVYGQDEDGDTMLHLAIIQPVPDQIEKLIHFCPTPDCLNTQNNLQQTPLHLAVLTNQPYVARKLISMGAQLDTRDRNGNTALHLACKLGETSCVQALTLPITEVEKKDVPYFLQPQKMPQNMSLKNYDGETCLHIAAGAGNLELVHFLIHNCHADINSQEGKSGRTILHQAVEVNHYQLVSYLLQQNRLNIEACTYDMSTPLKLAYGRRFSSVMSLLMRAGADTSQLSGEDSGTDSDDEMMESCNSNDNMME